MTGKLLRLAIKLSHFTILISPLSSSKGASPLMKWATTSKTRYPMLTRAIKLVYLSESSRRRKLSGITINLPIYQLLLLLSCVSTLVTDPASTGVLHSHEPCDPKPPLPQHLHTPIPLIEASHDPWHQISNNDEIAHPYTKTLHCNRSIKHHGCIRVCNLAEGEEG